MYPNLRLDQNVTSQASLAKIELENKKELKNSSCEIFGQEMRRIFFVTKLLNQKSKQSVWVMNLVNSG